jgi:hypothetical protein
MLNNELLDGRSGNEVSTLKVEIARLKATPNLASVSSSTHGKDNKGDK